MRCTSAIEDQKTREETTCELIETHLYQYNNYYYECANRAKVKEIKNGNRGVGKTVIKASMCQCQVIFLHGTK